jgi:HlyD family secretion protein
MDHDLLHRFLQALRPKIDPDGAAIPADRELLKRFAQRGDQAAFELLLWRHGPMVLGLCRRLLTHNQDVEDAFQATFLTLVRRGRSITRGEAVGSWLYRVAYRVALRSRRDQARRFRRQRGVVEELVAPEDSDPTGDELHTVLAREIDRLPARERAAFVLCCMEGKTGEEAARQLGCPAGTISSRLTRARLRLRSRLARRGLAPPAVALVLATAEDAGASAWAARVASTLNAVQSFAAGRAPGGALSEQAVVLARGVWKTMFLKKIQIVALMLLVAAALTTGGILCRHGLEASPPTRAEDESRPAEHPVARAAAGKGPAVHVVKPLPGGLERTIQQPCNVLAANEEDIFPVVAGVLQGQKVDIGDRVQKGQVLAEIDAPLLELEERQATATVRQAEAQVEGAKARVGATRSEIRAAENVVVQRQADLDTARVSVTSYKAEWARASALLKNKVYDVLTADEVKGALEAAKAKEVSATAALASAKALVESRQSEVVQAEAAVAIARANVEAAEVTLAKARYSRSLTRLVSPLDGVVTWRGHQNGDYVRPLDQGGRLPLLTVQQTDKLRMVVEIPERDVPLVRTGAPVNLAFSALPRVRFPDCSVSRIAFVEDPKTRTMRVEIDVPNPNQVLRPGMLGVADIHAHKGPATALRVPASCLVRLPDDQSAVYVVRDGKAHRVPVQIGVVEDPGQAEVLSGLQPEDAVVADPKGVTNHGHRPWL